MPLVSSSSSIPIWILSTNNRTRLNKFNRCKSLQTLSTRLNKIQSTASDRIDNKDKIADLQQSHKQHEISRNRTKRMDSNKIQRENLLMFLRLEHARFGPEKNYPVVDPRVQDLYKFKDHIRKHKKKQFQQKCKKENKQLYQRINSLEPSRYLDRQRLSRSFKSNNKVKKVMVDAKSRLRIDSFQIKAKMDREHQKMSLKYKDMAKQMEMRRAQSNTTRRTRKPKLPTKELRRNKKHLGRSKVGRSKLGARPQSARVGVTRNNVLIPKVALQKKMQVRPKSAIPNLDDSIKENRPSMVSIISAPQSTIRKHVNQLSMSYSYQHDDTSLSYYLNQN